MCVFVWGEGGCVHMCKCVTVIECKAASVSVRVRHQTYRNCSGRFGYVAGTHFGHYHFLGFMDQLGITAHHNAKHLHAQLINALLSRICSAFCM